MSKMFNEEDNELRLIYCAIQARDIYLIKNILRGNKKLLVHNNQLGENLIHHAVKYNFEELVKLLIKNGLSVDSADCRNATPLHFAVSSKNEEMVKCLLEHNANPAVKNLYGLSPFHLAVDSGNLRIIELLLENGADIMDTTSSNYQTALHIALKNENVETFQLLLSHFSGNVNVSDEHGDTLLHILARQRHENLAKLLIDKGVDVNAVNKDNETALHFAIHRRNFVMSKLFLEHNANVNIKNKHEESPLHLAVRSMDFKFVELLLEHNANVDERTSKGNTMLHVAINYYKPVIVDLLIQRGVEIDIKNSHSLTPFHEAIKNRCIDSAKQILQYGVDVNTVAFGNLIRKGEHQHFTPLHTAIVQNDLDAVEFLLQNGASFENDRDIFLGVEFACTQICDILIQYGAKVNVTNASGRSLLYIAMKSRNIDKVNMLLQRGADRRNINETDEHNQSALHLAVKAGDKKFVEFLLDIGVDVNICDTNEATALCLAQGEVAEVILASLALSKANGFFVCAKNESVIGGVQGFGLYFEKCMIELERIRDTRYRNVSLIRFLRDDATVWGRYVMIVMLQMRIDPRKYPTYWNKLLVNVDKGLRRWLLIRRVKDILCGFDCLQPLYDVLEDIVDNFTDDELNSFVLNFNVE